MTTEPPPGRNPAGSRSVVAVCCLILALEGFDLTMFGSIVPSLLDYEPWALTPDAIGRISSFGVLGMLVGALAAAGLADRIGRRPVVIAAVTLFSVCMGLSAITPSVEVFTVLRLVVGIGAGAVMPTVAATLVEYAPHGRIHQTTALGFVGVAVGGVIAGISSLWLIPSFGFHSMFVAGFVPMIVLVPMMLKYLPESIAYLSARGRDREARALAVRYGVTLAAPTPAAANSAPSPSKGLLALVFGEGRAVGTVLFWVGTFFCLLVTFGVGTWLPQLMKSAGYSSSSSLVFLAILNVGAIVGVLAASRLADRIGSKPVTVAAFVAAAAALTALSFTPPVAVAYVMVAIVGLGTTGTQILLNSYVGSYYPAEVRATGIGLNLSIGRIGGVLGPAYLGMLVGAGIGLDAKFYALAVPALLGGLAIVLVPRRTPDDTGDITALSGTSRPAVGKVAGR